MPLAEPIIVVGAGAIGSIYAVKLSARHPVTVVVRPDHAAAIRAGGLRLIGRETVTARVEAVTAIDTIAPGELKTVTIPLDEQPPTGQNVPIAVDVKPVPGEQKTDNNKQEFSVIFTS